MDKDLTIDRLRESSEEAINEVVPTREEVFKDIQNELGEIREQEKNNPEILNNNPIAYVFEASVEDGLKLAKQLRLTPEEIQKYTKDNPWFYTKHESVISRANNFAQYQLNVPFQELVMEYHNIRADHLGDILEKRNSKVKKEYAESSKQATDLVGKLENHYAQFLPYKAETMKHEESEPFREYKRNPQLEMYKQRADDILFSKYAKGLSETIFDGSEESTANAGSYAHKKFSELGIPEAEQMKLFELADRYHKADNNLNFPVGSIAFKMAGGKKVVWDLDRSRKPVNKIVETITKNEIAKEVERQLNSGGYSERLRVEKNENLDRYVIEKEYIVAGKAEREEYKAELSKALFLVEDLFNKNSRFLLDSSSMESLKTYVHEVTNSEEFEKHEKEINFPREIKMPLKEAHDLFELSNVKLNRYLQYDRIADSIKERRYREALTFIDELAENKHRTYLKEEDILSLRRELVEDATTTYVTGQDETKALMKTLNALNNPSVENLKDYFVEKSQEEKDKDASYKNFDLKQRLSKSLEMFKIFQEGLKNKMGSLLRTVSAKPDIDTWRLGEKLARAWYPEEYAQYEKRQIEIKKEKKKQYDTTVLFQAMNGDGLTDDRFESRLGGGNPNESASVRVATLDTPVKGMFVTNIVAYDPVTGIWKRHHTPVDGDMNQGRDLKKVSATLEHRIGRIIPAPLGAENINVIGTNSSEVSQDSLGLVHLEGDRNIVGWSYEIPETGSVPLDVDEKTHTRFLSRFIEEGGAPFMEKNPNLPLECKMFVDTIKELPPLERVQKIQEFVTNSSFYDSYDNLMREDMNNARFAERCELMKDRMEELRDELTETDIPSAKIFAGVCADFAMLTESMYREAGIGAAVVEGYSVNGTEINSKNAHAKTGIFWADANGKTVLHEIETTPSAITEEQKKSYEEQGIAPQPVAEAVEKNKVLEKKATEEIEKDIQQTEKTIEETLQKIQEQINAGQPVSPELLKQLNAQSQELRAGIAEYVQQTGTLADLSVYKGVLNAMRFSSVIRLDPEDISAQTEGMKFVQGEYKRLQSEYAQKESSLERISHLGKNFMGDLDVTILKARADKEDVPLVSYIGKIGKFGGQSIPETHKKTWSMVEAYMKAKYTYYGK